MQEVLPNKYVVANIPSYRLYAYDGDSILTMRIGCGTKKTKTPLLSSKIYRMDINPQWIIPRSIIEKDITNHVGDVSYFERRRYFVKDKQSGKHVDLSQVTWNMLHDKRYLVIQEGGKGNSLGRIIFRFENNFSVFLHDTSSPGVFSRENRDVSHGCVRVEKPYELAVFMLDRKDEQLQERIKYSMTVDLHPEVSSNEGEDIEQDAAEIIDRSMLISSVPIEPEIPIQILYYTIYPDSRGNLNEYPDVYGYDKEILTALRKYL